MRNINASVLSGVDTASQNGAQLDTNQWVSASFQIVFADATAVGTFKLQASNDVCPPQQSSNFTVTNWTDIPSATASITAGASALISLANVNYRWIRAVYTRASGGSTTVSVTCNGLSV